MKYQIVIEKYDEEFELIDEVDKLDDAIEIVKHTPIETYKAIMIFFVDEKGKLIKEIELEVR